MMTQQDLQYALAKQVPDIHRGCSICTTYGVIAIPPGWIAEAVVRALERILQTALLQQVKQAQHAIRQEAGHVL